MKRGNAQRGGSVSGFAVFVLVLLVLSVVLVILSVKFVPQGME